MADIELIVKIPEEEYNIIKKLNGPMTWGEHLIKEGIPLPKGHGRIIDESQITATFTWDNESIEFFAPTIIEADKEES